MLRHACCVVLLCGWLPTRAAAQVFAVRTPVVDAAPAVSDADRAALEAALPRLLLSCGPFGDRAEWAVEMRVRADGTVTTAELVPYFAPSDHGVMGMIPPRPAWADCVLGAARAARLSVRAGTVRFAIMPADPRDPPPTPPAPPRATPPAAPEVRVSVSQIDGTVTTEEIEAVITRQQRALAQSLAGAPSGRLVIAVEIADGAVRSVRCAEGAGAAASRALQQIRRWRFPSRDRVTSASLTLEVTAVPRP